MTKNELIPYKENIFTKISNFFKKLFFRKKENKGSEKNIYKKQLKEDFIENIAIKENAEEKRLKELKHQYDNGEINEEDILEKDLDKLIEMYQKETLELKNDTERRKKHIVQMLKELKQTK